MRYIVLVTALAFVSLLAVSGQMAQADPLDVASASGAHSHQAVEMGNQEMVSHVMESSQDMADTSTLRLDRSQVRVVQRALNDRGYNSGPVDGIIGPITRSAITSFQENEGLTVTGLPNEETLLTLAPEAGKQEHYGLSPEFGEDEIQGRIDTFDAPDLGDGGG